MRAIEQKVYGGPEVMRLVEVADPAPTRGQVVIEVHASPVTQGDRRIRAGDFPGITAPIGRLAVGLWGPRARVPGSMVAGKVVAIGEGVRRFQVGDEVFGACLAGSLAERVAMSERGALARLPAGWSLEQASALSYGAGTALSFLDRAGVAPGERVLVIGSGGVGWFAAQIARHRGADVVVAGRRATSAQSALESLEGDFDVIFDTVGAWTVAQARARLRDGGRYVTLLVTLAALIAMLLPAGRRRVYTGAALDDATTLEKVRALAESGAVAPRPVRTFPLERTAEAHAAVEGGCREEVVVVPILSSPAHTS